MPAGNRRGPMGMGPMSGRGAGYCAGYEMPGYANPMGGRPGMGMRAFGGRGHRYWFHATGQPGWMRMGTYSAQAPAALTPEQEQQILRDQEALLQEQLNTVREQINKKKKNR